MKIKRFFLAIAAMFTLPARASLAVNTVPSTTPLTLPPAEGVLNLLPTAAHAANVLVKWGADQNKYDVCGAHDQPLGIVTSAVLAGETNRTQAVYLLGSWRKPELVTAAEEILFNKDLYAADDGKVQDKPASPSGDYYLVGRALGSAVSGTKLPMQHCFPAVKITIS